MTFEIQTYHIHLITASDININFYLSELFVTMKLFHAMIVWCVALPLAVLAVDEVRELVREGGNGSSWVQTPVLKVNETMVLKLDLSVIELAAALHDFDLDLHHRGVKINPDLVKNARVARTKDQLKMALHGLIVAIQPLVPDFVRANLSENHVRSKRSIMGWIATTGDLDSMNNVIENLKGSENMIMDYQKHLTSKVNSLTDSMAEFIKEGAISREAMSRSLLHLQSEVILTAWAQSCKDTINELQLLTSAVLGGTAPSGLFHPLERGKLLSAQLNNETFNLLFFLERFYSVMAECRQIESASPLCRLPGPIFFRPGTFRKALALGIDTVVYSDESNAEAETPLGEAPVCRVKSVNGHQLPYFCWAKNGHSGKPDSPTVASLSWHSMSVQGFEMQTEELTRKFGQNDKIWKHIGIPGFSHFAMGGPAVTVFPPWAWVLVCSVAALSCIAVGVGFAWARMRKEASDTQKLLGNLKAEINDLRGVVLTFRARNTEQDASIRAEIEDLRARFRR